MLNNTKNTTIKQENKSRYRNKSRCLNTNKKVFHSVNFNKINVKNFNKVNLTNSKFEENKKRADKFYKRLENIFYNIKANEYKYNYYIEDNSYREEENKKINILTYLLDILTYFIVSIFFPIIIFETIKDYKQQGGNTHEK